MSRLVFICPECGLLLNTFWEVCKRETSYLISVGGSVVDEVPDDWETPIYLECPECNAQFDRIESVEDLVAEVVEDETVVYATPIGDYWVNNPQKLADVLATSTGKKVEVVSRDQLPA